MRPIWPVVSCNSGRTSGWCWWQLLFSLINMVMENIGTSPFSNSRCIVIHHFLIGDTASHVSFPGRFLQILGTCLVIWVRRTSGMWTTMAGDVCQKWRSQRVIRFLKDGHETNHAFGVPFSYCRTTNTIQVIHEISIFVFLRFHEKKWELLSWCFADRMLGFPWAMKETLVVFGVYPGWNP